MEINRALVIDRSFKEHFSSWKTPLPPLRPYPNTEPLQTGCSLKSEEFLDILHAQMQNRALDIVARELRAENEGFYTISSSGHEGNGVVAFHSKPSDMAFLHYRSGTFMMQRARQANSQSPIFDTCLSFVASSEDPIAGGRHKVWGSVELGVPPQTSTIASHAPKAVGAAFAFPRTKKDQRPTHLGDDAVFLCSFGDASLNHSTIQGSLNTASWIAYQNLPLPLVFVCEDNGLGISVSTPHNWVQQSIQGRASIKYMQADGTDVLAGSDSIKAAIDFARQHRRPVFLHLKVVRLLGHAGSDPEYRYRTMEDIEESESRDPLLNTANQAVELGLLRPGEVLHLYNSILDQTRAAGIEAKSRPRHESPETIMEPLKIHPLKQRQSPANLSARETFWKGKLPENGKEKHLAKLLNIALHDLMLEHDQIIMFGEDVAIKGGVYTVTTDLYKRFGLGRIFNTLLDEQAILGLAIGAAHVGLLPIPEIQYLAYLHNAVDQLRGEACSLLYFSEGQFSNPMVVRIASFAYQKGFGGHFHNDNSIASLRDIPGLIIAAPSTPADAVHMLRASIQLAREQKAVVAFLEPIALYMTKDLLEPGDGRWLEAYPAPGNPFTKEFEPGFYGPEDADLLIITYSNGHFLSRQAQADLEQDGHKVRVMDLRWLLPLNDTAIAEAAKKARRILIVDEGRKTGGISEAIFTVLCEQLPDSSPENWERVVGHDTFIPLGRAWTYVLPSREGITKAAKKLLNKPSKAGA
jgi:2-oxoisovalerate dehydrogenase E1 component